MFDFPEHFGCDPGLPPGSVGPSLRNRQWPRATLHKGDAPEQEETEAEKAFADVARQRWNYQKDVFGGATQKYMSEVKQQDSGGAYEFARGSASTGTKAAFAEPKEKAIQSLTERGVNPNSGRYRSTMAGLSDAEAASSADTQGRAVTQQQDEYVQGVTNVAAMGRGEAGEAQQGLGDVAQLSHQKAGRDAQTAWNDKATQNQAIGTVTGMAASGLSDVNSEHNQLNRESGYDFSGDPFATA